MCRCKVGTLSKSVLVLVLVLVRWIVNMIKSNPNIKKSLDLKLTLKREKTYVQIYIKEYLIGRKDVVD